MLYHETHFAPLLAMQGQIGGVALELRAADGTRLPVLVNSVVKTSAAGEPLGTLDAALHQGFSCQRAFLQRDLRLARYLVLPGGPLVGVFDNPVFEATTIRLEPGDTLRLYTDGLTEARTDAALLALSVPYRTPGSQPPA